VRVGVALLVGFALIAATVGLVLSGSPMRVLGTNSFAEGSTALIIPSGSGLCQDGEVLPRGTSALRLDLDSNVGPRVTVTVLSRGHVLARGTHGSGWVGGNLTVGIARIRRTTRNAEVCFALAPARERVLLVGGPVRDSGLAVPPVRMGVEYLAPGQRSWWSSALSVARRIGLGRAPSGTWVVLLPVALMLLVAMLAACLCLRELGGLARKRAPRTRRRAARPLGRLERLTRRLPRAAWLCALIACLNAAAWSILSPPFQVPDEPAHFAYAQRLAEVHRLPANSGLVYSVEEETILDDLRHFEVQFRPGEQTISTEVEQRKLEHDLAQQLPASNTGDAGVAATEPPLYYALESIPFELASGGTLLDRLELMRLSSAIFGGLTALFAFMFVREALPGIPWAWTVGGLGVALAPLLGFMSGAVNPDALLFAISAALFYLLARALRRGLTCALAAAIGANVALGLLTQLDFTGLVPGALAGLLAAALRTPARSRRARFSALGVGLGILAGPALLYLLFSSLANQQTPSLVSALAANVTQRGSIPSAFTYIWQLYLPRLPGMSNYFPGIFTTRQLWFDGLVGLYGWAETVFPAWVDDLALAPAAIIVVLCLRELFVRRAALAARTVELLVYASMGVGVLLVVGVASFDTNVLSTAGPYWEPRYLLPLLPLFGAVLALAARGAGRRWGPAVGTLIVVLILAHDLFSQLLVVSRYYG
jgi:Predicted membrane protein (DUF2142)